MAWRDLARQGFGGCVASHRVYFIRAVDRLRALGQRMLSEDVARAIVETWLMTPFDGGRHSRRIAKIDAGRCAGD